MRPLVANIIRQDQTTVRKKKRKRSLVRSNIGMVVGDSKLFVNDNEQLQNNSMYTTCMSKPLIESIKHKSHSLFGVYQDKVYDYFDIVKELSDSSGDKVFLVKIKSKAYNTLFGIRNNNSISKNNVFILKIYQAEDDIEYFFENNRELIISCMLSSDRQFFPKIYKIGLLLNNNQDRKHDEPSMPFIIMQYISNSKPLCDIDVYLLSDNDKLFILMSLLHALIVASKLMGTTFAHNDMHMRNILVPIKQTKKGGKIVVTGDVKLIDYGSAYFLFKETTNDYIPKFKTKFSKIKTTDTHGKIQYRATSDMQHKTWYSCISRHGTKNLSDEDLYKIYETWGFKNTTQTDMKLKDMLYWALIVEYYLKYISKTSLAGKTLHQSVNYIKNYAKQHNKVISYTELYQYMKNELTKK